MKNFIVESYDAWDSPDERFCIRNGEFDTAEEAVNFAKKMIDEFLIEHHQKGASWDDAYKNFCSHGDIPMVFGKPEPDFNAINYAKSRVEELNKGVNRQLF